MKNLVKKNFVNMTEQEQARFIKTEFTRGINQVAFSRGGLASTVSHYLIYNLTEECEAVGILPKGSTDKQRREKYLELCDKKGAVYTALDSRGSKLGADAGEDLKESIGVWARVVTDEAGAAIFGSSKVAALLYSSSPAYKTAIEVDGNGVFRTRSIKKQVKREHIKGFPGSPMEGADIIGEATKEVDGKHVPYYLCRWFEVEEVEEVIMEQAYYKTYYSASEGAQVVWDILNNAQRELFLARFKGASAYSFSK